MIKMFRIDERLIHGQIAIKWSRHTGVDHIVVGNYAAANSPIIQKSLKMAAPAGIKTAIRSVDDAIALLQDPRCEAMKILMLVNSPEDAERVVAAVSGIPYINIGNYGRIAPAKTGHAAQALWQQHLLRPGGSRELQASDRDWLEMYLSDDSGGAGRGYYQPV